MLKPEYLQLTQQKLAEFAAQDDFAAKMELAFGSKIDRATLTNLGQRWQQSDFGELPEIEVLQNGELGTANGAYAAKTQKIYLSSTFLSTASTEQIVGVLIEEIGHSVDTVLNTVDAIGDEGALFSELVQGNPLSASDIISLQAEDDHALVNIDGQQVWVEQNIVAGTAGNDTLVGVTNSGDVISGLEGNDTLTGLSGNDTLSGGSGDDTLTGGAGNDTFILESFNGSGYANELDVVTDFVQGQDKIDVSSLGISDFSTISSVMSNDAFNNTVISTRRNSYDGYGYRLQLNGINRNALTAADFTFATIPVNNTISSGIYNSGLNNNDLFGGSGNNTLLGGAGNDRLFGEAGIDRLVGGSGSDLLSGGTGTDTFALESFNGSGYANDLDVVTDFVQGQDKIDVSGLGISEFNTILALTNNDVFNYAVITTNRNNYDGYGYNLKLNGINRNALTAADFTFATTSLNNTLSSGIYNGGVNNNDLFGGSGNNTLQGGAGDDRLFGEAGIDRLVGSSGSDLFTGGTGNDTFVLENFIGSGYANDLDVVTDFVQGQDKIDVSGLGISNFNTILALTTNDVVNNAVITTHRNSYDGYGYRLQLNGTNRSTLTAADFTFASTTFNNDQSGSVNNDDLFGGLGNETLLGGAGDDRLFGEAGTDRLVGGSGSDLLSGGAGNDTFVLENFNGSGYANDLDVVTDFVQGQDKIDVSGLGISEFNTILALASNDASNTAVITTHKNNYDGYAYSLKLNGINRSTLTASDFTFATTTFSNNQTGTSNNDDLFGGLGNDALVGGTGDDRLFGENGNDTLNGGGGKDSLYGGLGDDTYVVQNNLAGGTVIEDAGGNDTLQLSAVVNSTTGWSKSGTSLLIDLNADTLFNNSDLTIRNFFSASDAAGSGFIENLANLSGSTILGQYNSVRSDFNGDKKADILWRNDDGRVALWQMNGSNVTTGSVLDSVPTNWKIANSGDFNGDGKSDILWRNTDGSVAIWTMNGATSLNKAGIGSVPTAWTISGTGDFGGDKKSDILWRNTNGDVAMWQMNGTATTSASVFANVPTDWQIAGTGDFGGDGKADILWRKTNGDVALWQMNGTATNSTSVFDSVPTDWKIAGTADFNGDGKSDILWRNSTNGQVAVWKMDGATVLSKDLTTPYSAVDNSWKISGTGDFTGDGKADILWRNDNGSTSIWEMNGASVLAANPTNLIVDNTWKIAAPIL
jgi:Ca2+-binding RTX toxin-like protein